MKELTIQNSTNKFWCLDTRIGNDRELGVEPNQDQRSEIKVLNFWRYVDRRMCDLTYGQMSRPFSWKNLHSGKQRDIKITQGEEERVGERESRSYIYCPKTEKNHTRISFDGLLSLTFKSYVRKNFILENYEKSNTS